MLLKTCILNGCDYLESIKGIGFKKAVKLIKEHNGDINSIINELIGENFIVHDNYLHDF
jgi:5'-3' exonuclease